MNEVLKSETGIRRNLVGGPHVVHMDYRDELNHSGTTWFDIGSLIDFVRRPSTDAEVIAQKEADAYIRRQFTNLLRDLDES